MSTPDFYQISYQVTQVLANATDSQESVKAILKLLTSSLAWTSGSFGLWMIGASFWAVLLAGLPAPSLSLNRYRKLVHFHSAKGCRERRGRNTSAYG